MTEFEGNLEELEHVVSRACGGDEEWPRRVAAAVGSALRFAAENPAAARVLAVESADLDSADNHRHLEMIERFARLLETSAPCRPAASSERALISSVVSVVADGVRAGEHRRLPEAAPELVCLLLVPYVGFDDARHWAAVGGLSGTTGLRT